MSAIVISFTQAKAAHAARVSSEARAARIADIVADLEHWERAAWPEVIGTYLLEGWATDSEMREAQDVLKRKETAK